MNQPQPTIPETPSMPQPQPTPSVTPSKPKNKVYWIILIVAAVIVLSGSIYIICQGRVVLPKLQNIIWPKKETFPNWQIYQNEKYGFEVKYPQNLKIDELIIPAGTYYAQYETMRPIYRVTFKDGEPSSQDFYVTIYNNLDKLSIEQWEKKYSNVVSVTGTSFLGTPQKITVDRAPGLKGEYGCCQNYPWSAFFGRLTDNKVFQVNVPLPGGEKEDLENILDTFKFIETNEIADWKTYRNEKYGFEVKYPKDWYSYTSNPADIYLQPKQEIAGAIPGPHADAFEIKINSTLPGITLLEAIQEEFRKEGNEGIDFSQKNVKIGGIDGLKIKTICEGVGCGAPEWFVIKDNYLYHFDSNLGYTDTFNQILSTFRFIKTNEITNWQTYRNEKLGFLFRYPDTWRLNDDSIKGGAIQLFNYPADKYTGGEKPLSGDTKIEMVALGNPNSYSLIDFIERQNQANEEALGIKYNRSQKEIRIGANISAIEETLEKTIGEAGKIIYVAIANKKILSVSIPFGYKANQETITQILSTFKFIK